MSYGSRPQPVTIPGLWLNQFTATLSAMLVAGMILGFGVRVYLHWSVRDTAETMKARSTSRP